MKSLIVLFSLGMSLKKWEETGLLEKEMRLFNAYLERGLVKELYLFTYDECDSALLEKYKSAGVINRDIKLIKAPAFAKNRIGRIVYSLTAFLFASDYFKKCDALYSNQTSGSWVGAIVKGIYKKRFIYRYGHSLWRRHLDRSQYARLMFSYPLDRLMTYFSDRALVCSNKEYNSLSCKKNVEVCPNYIDLDKEVYRDINYDKKIERAVFIGRLIDVKNIDNIMLACHKAGIGIDIFGKGEKLDELKVLVKEHNIDCDFKGVVANDELQSLIIKYKYFFLVSKYEGMPKALLEGMAAGCVCFTGPHFSCIEVVENEVDGYICEGFEVDDIYKKIMLSKTQDWVSVARNANATIGSRYSLDFVLEKHNKAINS